MQIEEYLHGGWNVILAQGAKQISITTQANA
jgi:hypothetical protein